MYALRFTRLPFAVLVLSSIVANFALGQTQYTVTYPGTLPGGSGSRALGVNDMGQVVGEGDDSSGDQRAFLYSNGTMQDLGTLPGTIGSVAACINSSGQVAGY